MKCYKVNMMQDMCKIMLFYSKYIPLSVLISYAEGKEFLYSYYLPLLQVGICDLVGFYCKRTLKFLTEIIIKTFIRILLQLSNYCYNFQNPQLILPVSDVYYGSG